VQELLIVWPLGPGSRFGSVKLAQTA